MADVIMKVWLLLLLFSDFNFIHIFSKHLGDFTISVLNDFAFVINELLIMRFYLKNKGKENYFVISINSLYAGMTGYIYIYTEVEQVLSL